MTAKAGSIVLYTDATPVWSLDKDSVTLRGNNDGKKVFFTIGGSLYDTYYSAPVASAIAKAYQGWMDEFSVYSSQLSADQIANLMMIRETLEFSECRMDKKLLLML